MNNWNSLEKNLRKWEPRRPSPELRLRIFRNQEQAATPALRLTDLSRWLIPVFGCFLLVVGTLSNRYPVHAVFPTSVTNLLLTENAGAYHDVVMATRADHSDVNRLPIQRVEWTFGARGSNATIGSILASHTNSLIQ